MTPKEKAVELIRKMYDNGSTDSCEVYRELSARKCALILVEEIRLQPYPVGKNIDETFDIVKYWKEVKEEIEKDMKLQIDTTEKTIKIEEEINLGELTDKLEKLLPNGEWREYKLLQSVMKLESVFDKKWELPSVRPFKQPYINPFKPIVQPDIPYTTQPNTPFYTTCQGDNGKYNLEV